jgi:hypothetical protein
MSVSPNYGVVMVKSRFERLSGLGVGLVVRALINLGSVLSEIQDKQLR